MYSRISHDQIQAAHPQLKYYTTCALSQVAMLDYMMFICLILVMSSLKTWSRCGLALLSISVFNKESMGRHLKTMQIFGSKIPPQFFAYVDSCPIFMIFQHQNSSHIHQLAPLCKKYTSFSYTGTNSLIPMFQRLIIHHCPELPEGSNCPKFGHWEPHQAASCCQSDTFLS